MDCIYCPNCIAKREREDEAAMLYDRGTLLIHPKLGEVTYWRGAPDRLGHVVFGTGDNEDQSYDVSAENLTLA